MVETPTNMLQGLRPGTASEAVSQTAVGRPKLIAKAALLSYLTSFLDDRGFNRPLLAHMCPKIEGMYDCGISPQTKNAVKKRMQLARLFENLKKDLPAVIITEDGSRNEAVGLGGYDGIHVDPVRDKAILRSTNAVRVSVTISIGADDLTTCGDIADAVAMMCGATLRRLGGGDMITNQRFGNQYTPGSWVLHLPMTEVNVGSPAHQSYGDDPTSGFYISSISLADMYFEASSYFEYDHKEILRDPSNPADLAGDADESDLLSGIEIPAIPDIPLGRSVTIAMPSVPLGARLIVANRNVAVVRNGIDVHGRGIGETTLRLVMPGATRDDTRVLDERTITVVYGR